MGLVDKIKADVKKSGQNKSKFIYFKEGVKQRIRFLTDMDDGMEITFHDSFEKSIIAPCQEHFGRTCPLCEDEELRHRSQYVWSVYNYDTKEVQLFMYPVNNCSPIPALMAMYENYGTICDRDYVISVSGKQQNKTFSVVPMDKVKFRNEKAKPYSDKAILKMLDKAFPFDGEEDEDEDDVKPVKSSKNTKKAPKPEPVEDDFDDEVEIEEDWEEVADDDVIDYSDMSPKELYEMCKEREIKVPPKKPAKFYINQLEEWDKAHEDWNDEEEDTDDWEDE